PLADGLVVPVGFFQPLVDLEGDLIILGDARILAGVLLAVGTVYLLLIDPIEVILWRHRNHLRVAVIYRANLAPVGFLRRGSLGVGRFRHIFLAKIRVRHAHLDTILVERARLYRDVDEADQAVIGNNGRLVFFFWHGLLKWVSGNLVQRHFRFDQLF